MYLAISEAQESKYLNPSVGVAPAQSYLECPKPSVRSAQSQPKNSKCMDPKRGVGSPQSLPGCLEPSVTSLLLQPDTDLESFKPSPRWLPELFLSALNRKGSDYKQTVTIIEAKANNTFCYLSPGMHIFQEQRKK